MGTLHMLVGIPGSGKTTYCKNVLFKQYPNAVYVSSDKTRDENPTYDESMIWPVIYQKCADALKDNKDLIFDATNTTPKVRGRFDEKMSEFGITGYKKIAYYFTTDPNECVRRVLIRNTLEGERFLPTEIIPGYGETIITPTVDEGFEEVIIVTK